MKIHKLGECDRCEREILEGDDYAYGKDGYLCANCCRRLQVPTTENAEERRWRLIGKQDRVYHKAYLHWLNCPWGLGQEARTRRAQRVLRFVRLFDLGVDMGYLSANVK